MKKYTAFNKMKLFLCILIIGSMILGGCKSKEEKDVFVPDDKVQTNVSGDSSGEKNLTEEEEQTQEEQDQPAQETPAQEEPAKAPLPNSAYTAPDQDQNVIDVVVNAAANENCIEITWYDTAQTPGQVVMAKTSEMNGNTFPNTCTVTTAAAASAEYENYLANRAAVTGLEPNTRYTYMVGSSAGWSKAYSFKTAAAGVLDVILTGDIQLGTGDDDVPNEEAWARISQDTASRFPDYNMHINMGDVATVQDEYFWKLALSTPVFSNYVTTTVRGNHEGGLIFNRHFSTPNNSEFGLRGDLPNGHYWFRMGDVLFMVLNYQVEDIDILVDDRYFVKYVVEENIDAKWKVVLMHPSAFSSVEKYQGWPNENRTNLTAVMDEFGIDIAIAGHDHAYTRTYIYKNNTAQKTDAASVHNPDGTLYLILGSASGSQYHDVMSNPNAAKVIQNYSPQVSTMNFTENSMKLTLYDANSWDVLDTFEITRD